MAENLGLIEQIDLNHDIEESANPRIDDCDSGIVFSFDLNNEVMVSISGECDNYLEEIYEIEDEETSIPADSAITEHIQGTNSMNQEEIAGWLLGETRDTLEEIHELYCQHAATVGFSVRKAKQVLKHGTTEVKEKFFFCSAAGQRIVGKKMVNQPPEKLEVTDESSSKRPRKIRRVPQTRTGCNAMLRAKLNDDGQFEVIQHVMAHNHILTRQQWNHLHRSERRMTKTKGETIEAMQESGLKPMESFRYMSNEAGGDESIGHTVKDHLNFCFKLKVKSIEGGDSQAVIDKLYQQLHEDPDFFFRVRLDGHGRVCNLLWRDSMMLEDYKIYGDVTVFDTTFSTNRYNLICAPFVGINNHWKNVMFACAFVGDETMSSFVWLFETFKKAMGGNCPITIFTDQDIAMAGAIEQCFPNTRHRLCLWHLSQNAITRFGVLKRDVTFRAAFNKCLWGCLSPIEFESCWEAMIIKYGLKEHKWFKRLYSLKEKWSTALSKDFFSAGILSTQRSESTNHAVGFNANKKTSLTEFYGIFEETIKRWRRIEENDEFNCSKSIPTSHLPMCGLLKHASKVYTLTLFRDFEEEFKLAIGTQAQFLHTSGSKKVYEVFIDDRAGTRQTVTYDPGNQRIECPCKNFEESGWLCFHSIRILHMHNIQRIPEHYICSRWTKLAKAQIWNIKEAHLRAEGILNNFTPWRLHMVRKYYNIILKSHKNEKARNIIEESFKKDSIAIDSIIEAENTTGNTTNEYISQAASSTNEQVLDPARANTKGRSKKRMQGCYDYLRQSKRRKHREFGAKTPNSSNMPYLQNHLF